MKVPAQGGGGPGAKAIYQLLLNAGYSSVQAFGIMANMINESSLDPEAVQAGGQAYGLVQMEPSSYPGASGLVTGNANADAKAQIKYLAQVVPPKSQAVAGSTASQVAGNFASKFEKCAGCTPGGAQYKSRVANAATVSGWAKSGKWPTAGSSGTSSTGSPTQLSSGPGSPCILGFGGFLGFGSFCAFSKTNARALVGGLMMGAGALAAGVGLAVLVAGAFSETKAGQSAGNAVGRTAELAGAGVALVPGAEAAGAGIAAAGRGVGSYSRHKGTQRQEKQKSVMRQAREDESMYRFEQTRRGRASSTQEPLPDMPPIYRSRPRRPISDPRVKPASRAEAGF